MTDLLHIYHKLPYFLKTAIASMWGYRLHHWRYSKETENLVDKALEREYWSESQWKGWQEERLELLLTRAATQIPYYRTYWQNQRRKGHKSSWNYIENWPILEKEKVRKQPNAFVADDCDINKMYVDHTSGTTGSPITIYESRKTIRNWYAIFEARLRRWHNVSMRDNWGIFGGQLVIPAKNERPPYWVFNYALNQLYLSTFHISPDSAKDYLKGLNKYQPTHLIVYPSSATFLAHLILNQNLEPPHSIKVIFSNAEILLPNQRDVIEKAFNRPVVNTYGMSELLAAGSECQNGELHSWPEIGVFECIDDNTGNFQPLSDKTVGEYVLTGLLNSDMIFIRYKIGDRGSMPLFGNSECGRQLPTIRELQGRSNDMILTQDGRRLFWFNSIFYNKPIIESQIVQEELEKIIIYIVPAEGYSKRTESEIIYAMRSRVGEKCQIIVQITAKINRNKAGKLQAVVSKLM